MTFSVASTPVPSASAKGNVECSPVTEQWTAQQARRADRTQAGVKRQRNPGDRDKTNKQALKGRQNTGQGEAPAQPR